MEIEVLGFKIRFTPIKTIIICVLILNTLSLLSIYSAFYHNGAFKGHEILNRQFMWIAIAWLVVILFSSINYRSYFYISYIFYGLNLSLLLVVDVLGKTALGAQRWINIGPFTFQPSELSKIALIFILARLFSNYDKQSHFKIFSKALILVMINFALIFKQPDLGTALIGIFIFFFMGFTSGLKKRYFIIMIVLGIMATPLAWNLLKDYQKKRVMIFLNPNIDSLGAGYAIIQSKIAIGSGKILGKGFLSGTQNQLNFLPERHTDFIFTVLAEERGFIGSLFLLIIYWLILKMIIDQIPRIKDSFAKLLTIGISAYFFIHVCINIGMTLGLLPVVGIPLVFLSYGGSNLFISSMLIGIFFNIARKIEDY